MYYYVKNLQGDIVRIVDSSGTVVVNYSYNVWGKSLSVDYNSNNSSELNAVLTLNSLRYRGYVYDDETGLYYLQSRYYDPTMCRFINADVYCDTQSGYPLSTNMFAYCENCPLLRYDNNGKDCWWVQSSGAAKTFGHTSLLIQQKPGFWWYYYWGDKSIQLLFLGTCTQKELNGRIDAQIQYWNNYIYPKINYPAKERIPVSDKYNKTIRFEGDFSNCLTPIFEYMRSHQYVWAYDRDIRPFYYSGLPYSVYMKKYSVLSYFRSDDAVYSYHGTNYIRPYSRIIVGNASYDTFYRNCVQKCIEYLKFGRLDYQGIFVNNFSFQCALQYRYALIPNLAFYDYQGYGEVVYSNYV